VSVLRYTEGFPTAFRRRFNTSSSSNPSAPGSLQNFNLPFNQTTSPVSLFNNESMFVNTALALPSGAQGFTPNTTAGLADFGTRVKAVFNNLPNGVNIFVSTDAVNLGSTGTSGGCNVSTNVFTNCGDHFALTDGGEAGAFHYAGNTASSPGGGLSTQLTVVNSSATAVWEDLDSDPSSVAQINFNVWITFTSNPGATPPVPSLTSTTVNGSFAPLSTNVVAAPAGLTVTNAIPRFADTSSATVIFTIVPCVTNLLFPFVTSASGFDTGIAISNTSADIFATPQQTGTCTLNWFGTAFTGATAVTPNVLPGTTFVGLTSGILSSVTGGFTGYLIAQCRFQYAHGFAFVSDLGARNLAMGYLALIIPDPARAANGFDKAGVGAGEMLAQ